MRFVGLSNLMPRRLARRSPIGIVPALALGLFAPCHAETARQIEVEGGFRSGELDWSIAGNRDGTNPNVLSELTWSNLTILEVRTAGSLGFLDDRLVLAGSLGFGGFLDGDVQDSDYLGDNRTGEYSRSHSSNLDDFIGDGAVSLGHQWTAARTYTMDRRGYSTRWRFLLQVGLSWNEQRLRLTDGVQTLSRPDLQPGLPPPGPFAGLDSTYQARWTGPWVGAEFEHRIGRRSRIQAELEWHWSDYEATADWNLRDDFAHPVSFKHFADGQGVVFAAAWRGVGVERLYLRLRAETWWTEPGLDQTFLADGRVGATRLNPVNWVSALLSVGWRWGD